MEKSTGTALIVTFSLLPRLCGLFEGPRVLFFSSCILLLRGLLRFHSKLSDAILCAIFLHASFIFPSKEDDRAQGRYENVTDEEMDANLDDLAAQEEEELQLWNRPAARRAALYADYLQSMHRASAVAER